MSSGRIPVPGSSIFAAVAASAAALLLPVFSLTSITSSLFGTAVIYMNTPASVRRIPLILLQLQLVGLGGVH